MKRHTQTTGVRNWYGGDFIDLQAETLKVLDSFFVQYGTFVISGCRVAGAASPGKYDISSGLVALQGNDPDGNAVNIVAPFAGIAATTLPVYLTLACEVVRSVYKDGAVKPVAYNYKVAASNVPPVVPHLAVTSPAVVRFVDVIQDSAHRFVTDAERAVWNGKETTLGSQEKVEALRDAITDDIVALDEKMRNANTALKDGIVDEAPGNLNTLRKIAASINNDGQCYDSIMQKMSLRALCDLSNVTLSKSMYLNGYYKAPDGMMFVWGTAEHTGMNPREIIFPMSFKVVPYGFLATCAYIDRGFAGEANSIHIEALYINKAQVVVGRVDGSSVVYSDRPIKYLAFGRWA